MTILIIAAVLAFAVLAGAVFVSRAEFGRIPRGERLERIRRSPNFRDGEFRNLQPTPLLTTGEGRLTVLLKFLFRKKPDGLRPAAPVPAVKTDLRAIGADSNVVVWFGHSSYFVQADGRRMLVDPVFCKASPVAFFNKPFEGTDSYKPEDMPDIDYLVITHDHWDHLDYQTVTALRERVRKVVCPLGVGEHFAYWGFAPDRIVEMDWEEDAVLDEGFVMHCLPARHFSGRGLRANRTLWASFLVETPLRKIFMAGDGGYGTHFAQIGRRFPGIDLAVMENGQYNDDWRYIHLMPEWQAQAVRELNPRRVLTVHHSKFALARHPWDEPLANERALAASADVVIPRIGEVSAF